MHRTRNALKLLTAAAALTVCGCVSGCVSVQARPASAPPPAQPTRHDRDHDQRVGPQVVQAPAREALDPVMPPSTPPPRPATPKAAEPEAPTRRHHPRGRPGAHGHRPATHPPTMRPRPGPALPPTGGICALGKGYGGWADDSPEARICRDTYGN
ncbi:hypothetical protein ACFXOD_12415 [Streptomyces sp. NPDC059161]|uniref:hypothetical protein n=1 Tax=Streptomyces sp. NPDC059161 TaxID=3346749 RepID=UPI0036B74E68